MRSSTLTSAITVLLSIHSAAAWNIRRYPPPAIGSLPTTSSLSASLGPNQKHGDEGHAEGESYGAQPTTTASAAEEGSILATFPFIPSSTIPGVAPSVTEPALEEVESSLLASTKAPATEVASSTAMSTSVGIPSEAETPEIASSNAPSTPAVTTVIPTGTHAVESESTISTKPLSPSPTSTPVTEEQSTVATSNNANVGALASKSVGEDGQYTQLSFVPTTVFATGEAPTVTVTEAPRTVTQVEVRTVPQDSCEVSPASTVTLSASRVQNAEPVTITVTASQQSSEANAAFTLPSGSSSVALEPVTITQILTVSGDALLEQATVTKIQTIPASQEVASEPITITVIQTASAETQSCQAPSTITLGTDIAAYGALEPVTITEVVTQTVSADAAPATITINNNRLAEAKEVPAQIVTAFVTKEGVALPAQTITIIPDGIDEIDVEPAAPVLPPQPPKQNQNNQLEYAKPTAGIGSVGPDGQCQCACPCAPDAFPSTTFSFISVTTTKGFDAPASEEPTTTLRETRSTFQTIVISGTSTASDVAPTEAVEPIELDSTGVPIIIESTLFSTPVISSIPMASFGVGETTLASGSSTAEPAATTALASQIDASIGPDTPNSSSFIREPVFSSIPAASFGLAPGSSPAEPIASSSEKDTSIVLATSTLASSTASVTTTAAPSADEEAPVFTTTLDAPLETPEIGAIPKGQADRDGSATGSVVDTSIALDTPTSVFLATSTIAESTALVTATVVPSSIETPAEEAPVFTTTIDAPLETPELGAIPKSQAADGGEFFEVPNEPATPVESGAPSQTAQSEAVVTPAPEGEIGDEDINKYNLSSAIVLGNLGG